jgi:hypothetical protein
VSSYVIISTFEGKAVPPRRVEMMLFSPYFITWMVEGMTVSPHVIISSVLYRDTCLFFYVKMTLEKNERARYVLISIFFSSGAWRG